MIHGKKIVVVMPAYNAEKTLRRTWDELPHDLMDELEISRLSTGLCSNQIGKEVPTACVSCLPDGRCR
jgi:hypothetical protein